MRGFALALLFLIALTGIASPTRDNDDSCDISVLPAATLLLPYFEVALQPQGTTNVFTIINATAQEQIAHVTLWTDFAWPVADFNIYLTGYDTQAINLHDVIARGVIAPEFGTGTSVSDKGDFSISNDRLDLSDCGKIPVKLPASFVKRMQEAFTKGTVEASAHKRRVQRSADSMQTPSGMRRSTWFARARSVIRPRPDI